MINELVKRLSEDKHEVVIGHRDEPYEEIKERVEDGYIHIKFTKTRGGTELGINVDLNSTNVKDLDFTKGEGLLHIEGTTNLNYNAVRLIADVDLASRKGEGYLEVVSEEPIKSDSTFN
jgi:flagellar hook assembly protein FlgD